jgi:hypothetical protein
MQKAEVVLGVLRERGRRSLPCTQLHRQMTNKDLYLTAYGNIYSNQGSMTPGANEETADGMSEEKIEQIIEAIRCERYRFSSARRIYIPKKNGRLRPLGLPSWSDKLVGEVVRLLLEAYYEPVFPDSSHGFRRRRGCHTALRKINDTWTGTVWFIEGDISDCFGSLRHEILLAILAEKIHDQRFLRLIRNMLRAGYLEDWEYHETLSGCPQGGLCSAEHNPPNAQCWVMRSAALSGWRGPCGLASAEHNADDPFMRSGRGRAARDRGSADGRLACAGVRPGSGDDPPGLQGLDDGLVSRRLAPPAAVLRSPRRRGVLAGRGDGVGR